MKKIFVVLMLMVMLLLPAAATTKSLYVGESTLLAAPTSSGNATINQTACDCSSPYVKVEKYGAYGAKAIIQSVSSSGVVSAKKQGRTIIGAETDNGLKVSCEVTVPPNPSSLELPDHITFFEGRTIQMQLQIYPSDAYAQIAWSSSDEKVAQVDDRGQVSLLKSGTAVIRATAQNGVSASCLLTVKFPTNYLLLWLKDGSQEQYRLQTHPRVTYADGQLWVHSSEVSIGYLAEEVRKYTIGGDAAICVPTGISDVEASQPDDWCQMTKARPDSKILVYDVKGHLLTTGIVAQDGTYQYSLDAYPTGIYLIKTETTTIKIIKR